MAAEHQVRFSELHTKRANVIAEIYSLLVQAHWDGANFASPAEFSGEPDKREKFRKAMKSLFGFSEQFEKTRIYLPEDVYLLIDPIIEEMRGKVVIFGSYLDDDGALEAHEVKGHWADDARAKIKIAVDLYPIRFIAIRAKPKKDGGGWAVEEFD